MDPLTFLIPQHTSKAEVQPSSSSSPENDPTNDPSSSPPPLKILIHQVESDAKETEQQHNVGYVMWPSAVVLSRYITQHPSIVLDQPGDILELGAGCGLTGLTAAVLLKQEQEGDDEETKADATTSSQSNVIFTDYSPQVLENLERNIRLNQLDEKSTTVVGLDFFDQPEASQDSDDVASAWVDMDGKHHAQVGLVLAADVLCYSNDADLVANTLVASLVEGGRALVLSSVHRFGVENFAETCRNVGLDVKVTTTTMSDNDNNDDNNTKSSGGDIVEDATQLEHELGQTSGYQQNGHRFILFDVHKPLSPRPL